MLLGSNTAETISSGNHKKNSCRNCMFKYVAVDNCAGKPYNQRVAKKFASVAQSDRATAF